MQINSIEASPFDAGTADSGTLYKFDDNRPFLYKTTDYGKSWHLDYNNGIRDNFARCIREDPNKKNLLLPERKRGFVFLLTVATNGNRCS